MEGGSVRAIVWSSVGQSRNVDECIASTSGLDARLVDQRSGLGLLALYALSCVLLQLAGLHLRPVVAAVPRREDFERWPS